MFNSRNRLNKENGLGGHWTTPEMYTAHSTTLKIWCARSQNTQKDKWAFFLPPQKNHIARRANERFVTRYRKTLHIEWQIM